MAAEDNGINKNDKSTTKTKLAMLNTIQESMTSSNSLLRELPESSPQVNSAAKRKKHDPNESSQAVKSASEKSKPTTAHEVHNSASDEAHDSISD